MSGSYGRDKLDDPEQYTVLLGSGRYRRKTLRRPGKEGFCLHASRAVSVKRCLTPYCIWGGTTRMITVLRAMALLAGNLCSTYAIISRNLGRIKTNLNTDRKTADAMSRALTNAAREYSETEKAIVRKVTKVFVQSHASSSTGNASASAQAGGTSASAKASASVWEGKAGIDVEEGLYTAEGEAKALSAAASAEAKLEPWKASASASAAASVKYHVDIDAIIKKRNKKAIIKKL